MERLLYIKGLLLVSLLHSSQAQGIALPSPSPESALPSLGNVMDAVKAAFMEAVKISKDDAVQAVFKQVVEELGPQKNIAEEPSATANNTEDRLPAMDEHADNKTTNLSEQNAKQKQVYPKFNLFEQPFGLPDEQDLRHGAGQQHVELADRLNKSAEESVQEVDVPLQNLSLDLVESTQEQNESSEPKSDDIIGQKHAKQNESHYWSVESALEGVLEQQAAETGKQEKVKIEKVDGWNIDTEGDIESKIHKEELHNLVKQTQPQDQEKVLETDYETTVTIIVEKKENKHEHELEDNKEANVMSDKNSIEREATGHNGEEVEGLIPVSNATEKTSQELETTTSKDAWKIGVIAVAFFLILQTLVTITYILKCRRKRCSCAIPERVCEGGIGPNERYTEKSDMVEH